MKYFFLVLLILVVPAISQGELGLNSGETVGVGYLTKADGTKLYQYSEGDAVATTVNKDFPLVAFESKNSWLGIMATESVENGRAHVKYFKNGQNAKEGTNTAWLDLKDVERIHFDCCGDNAHCSGMHDPVLKSASFTDCFIRAMTARIDKKTPQASNPGTDLELEKLKIQLEIEKLKLEQERLKAGVK